MRGTLNRDLKEMYHFYVDEERKRKLIGKKRIKRWLYICWWLLEGLVSKLSPARRLIVVICLCLFLTGQMKFQYADSELVIGLHQFAFLGLLIVLMLELKDKLLAKDELKTGRAVQLALMPERNPQIPGWDVWLFTHPANDVGGDLVDYLQVGDNRWAIILADVSGKGLAAALLMAKLQSTIRAVASDHESLAELAAHLNHILYRDGIPGKFATMLYLEVKPDSEKIRVLNAGHIPPVIVTGNQFSSLPPIAIPIAAFPDAVFKEQELDLPPEALLIVYSDGLTEARNEKDEFFGEERFNALLPGLQGMSAEQAGLVIFEEVERFVGDARASDDFSIIILKRRFML